MSGKKDKKAINLIGKSDSRKKKSKSRRVVKARVTTGTRKTSRRLI
jgi:hypothetical protein